METNTIRLIRESKVSISDNIELYKSAMKNQPNIDLNLGQFGSESEYCINGLIGGVKNILIDITYLVKSHSFYIKISTYDERSILQSHLANLDSYIVNRNHSNIASTIDIIKVILRSYNLRHNTDRFIDFNNEIDNLQKKAIQLDDDINETKSRIVQSEEIYEEITIKKQSFIDSLATITTRKEELEQTIDLFVTKYDSFVTLAESASGNEAIIAASLSSVQEDEKVFNAFMDKIDVREEQLIKQGENFVTYDQTLENYKKAQEKILNDAKNLIDKSLQALQYTTSEGISTAFSNQYIDASKGYKTISWLVGAGVFIALTLMLGVWIITGWGIDKGLDPLITVIGRLSLIPFTLLASLFCANQFVKQKNLIEDYAYKTVLSKSMIAFSEELRDKDKDSYSKYLSTVLSEIHQDPLRKRSKDKDEISIKDSAGIFDKVIELVRLTTRIH